MTTIYNLPKEIISNVGTYLFNNNNEIDICNTRLSSKIFNNISHEDNLHTLVINSDTIYKLNEFNKYLDIIYKNKPNLEIFKIKILDLKNKDNLHLLDSLNILSSNKIEIEIIISSLYIKDILSYIHFDVKWLTLSFNYFDRDIENIKLIKSTIMKVCIKDDQIKLLENINFISKVTILYLNIHNHYDELLLDNINEKCHVELLIKDINIHITRPELIKNIYIYSINTLLNISYKIDNIKFNNLEEIIFDDFNHHDLFYQNYIPYHIVKTCPKDCKFKILIGDSPYLLNFINYIIKEIDIDPKNITLIFHNNNHLIIGKICQLIFNINIDNKLKKYSTFKGTYNNDILNSNNIKELYNKLDDEYKFKWLLLNLYDHIHNKFL